jgi:hypothetical protein
VPENIDGEPVAYTRFLNKLKPPHVVMRRSNTGACYGSYSDVYERYRDQFDYYIFIEDDYVFMLDNFDQILVSEFEATENCGYVCMRQVHKGFIHISIGIASSRALARVWQHYGELPHWKHTIFKQKHKCGWGQMDFWKAFQKVGYNWHHMANKYRVGVHTNINKNRLIGKREHPILILPYQLVVQNERRN